MDLEISEEELPEHFRYFLLEPFPAGERPGRRGVPAAEELDFAEVPGHVKERELQRPFLQLNPLRAPGGGEHALRAIGLRHFAAQRSSYFYGEDGLNAAAVYLTRVHLFGAFFLGTCGDLSRDYHTLAIALLLPPLRQH